MVFQAAAARWMSKPGLFRFIGACLILLSFPWLIWRGWYFWTLFAVLAGSGMWRLAFRIIQSAPSNTVIFAGCTVVCYWEERSPFGRSAPNGNVPDVADVSRRRTAAVR